MGKIAFVFSGQGAQYTGMGQELCAQSPAAAQAFAQADALRPGTSETCFTADKEQLSVTKTTQPCVFTVDYAAAAALREAGIAPDYLAGFSLGEVAALAFGKYMSFEEAFRYVCRRAELMDACAQREHGVMFAVLNLNAQQVEALCAQLDGAYPVNYNSPAQTVVSCREPCAEDFAALVKQAGGRAMKLAVSGGFHSPMMDEAAETLAQEYADLQLAAPELPVISNVTARPYEAAAQMFLQVHAPVQWQATVEYLIAQGVDCFYEVGPGKTLTGLIKKISKDVAAYNVEDQATLEKALQAAL